MFSFGNAASRHDRFIHKPAVKHTLLIMGIILVAFNLRPSITAVGPLIGVIRDDLGISNGMAGLLTTLPLLAFALLSALAPRIAMRFGNGFAILIGVTAIGTGILVRSVEMTFTLFFGTILIGIGIAIGNVLLPGIVKKNFPLKVGLMTGIYSICMSGWAAIGSAVSVPLAQNFQSGWQGSMAIWSILALIAFVVWLPQARIKKSSIRLPKLDPKNNPLWRSPLAWQVTLFMGLQSFLFYTMVSWLPEILQSRGMEPATAGLMLSGMQVAGLPGTFLSPLLAGKLPHQRGMVAGIGIMYLTGLMGLLIGGNFLMLVISIALIGLAQGSSISLALTLLSLRASTATQASNLSGMAQSVGYFLAAIGPISIGFLYDQLQSWTPAVLILFAIVTLLVIAGLGAGRNDYVPES
ncbi:MFS transporter [Thalassobacillus sp. CUG 92003]|uniref:CynX/NimT family MFS transporter n=1 Tax=Thalassobacillus sp. CUG 92003 TaxID=2736641 RepID=UPI0015E63A27|nr:MFS transporter [Thalassobacillus sp. CUG 92003]